MRPRKSDQLRTLLSRIASLFHGELLDATLDEELRSHIDLATVENMTLGMSRRQARTKALRDFGGLAQTREIYRVHRGFPLLGELIRDLRFAWRQLHRAPGFALTAILTLALGLGANTAIFSLINDLILRPLPTPHPEQLVMLTYRRSDARTTNHYFSGPMIRALEKHHEIFQDVAAYWTSELQLRGGSGNVEIPGALVSGQLFRVLQTPPLLGRFLTSQDDRPGNPAGFNAVISEGFWESWFNRAPGVIGSKLTIANTPFTVVGVMPRRFIGAHLDRRPSIYVPLSAEPIVNAPYSMLTEEGGLWLQILARRNPGISLDQTNAAMSALTGQLLNESITISSFLKSQQQARYQLVAEPGSNGLSYLRTMFERPLVAIFSMCGAMLLLACLNLASLLMARAAARERELATRLAIGATRRRLIQQLLIESMLISMLGCVAGLALTPVVSRALAALLLSGNRSAYIDTSLDLPVFFFAALLSLLASLLIGLIPALRATSGDLNDHIKSGSHTRSAGHRRHLLPRILMASEVALTLLLVTGAGLFTVSLTRLYRINLGFEPKGLIQMELDMDKQPLEGDALVRWYRDFDDVLSHQPGVRSVSFVAYQPLNGGMEMYAVKTPFSNGSSSISLNHIAPAFFSTMRIPMLQGRDFAWQDTRNSDGKIILNQSAANALFPGRSAIGQLVPLERDGKKAFEVIAVVGDARFNFMRYPAFPSAWLALTQNDQKKMSYTALIRMNGAASNDAVIPLASAVHALTTRMAPEIPAPVLTSMSKNLDNSLTSERMMAMLAVFFAICALLVTAIGLYGTLAYATARRTNEIGIRMALGARRVQVVTLVFRENAWIAVCGSLAGLAAALLASRALSSFLYGTSVRDPWVLAGSVAALISIASAASLLPAIRAARIEPMEALRTE
jgi:predicted permease